jgi:hypothetical protein
MRFSLSEIVRITTESAATSDRLFTRTMGRDLRREDAFAALQGCLRDEPDWTGLLYVLPIELDERKVSTN